MQRFFFFVLILVLVSACGTFRIEKRQYRSGWYLERSHKHSFSQQARDSASSVVAEATIDSLPDVRSVNGFIEEPYTKHDEVRPKEKSERSTKRMHRQPHAFTRFPPQTSDQESDNAPNHQEFWVYLITGILAFVFCFLSFFLWNFIFLFLFLLLGVLFVLLAIRSLPQMKENRANRENKKATDPDYNAHKEKVRRSVSGVLLTLSILFLFACIPLIFVGAGPLITISFIMALLSVIVGCIIPVPRRNASGSMTSVFLLKIFALTFWSFVALLVGFFLALSFLL
jgi:Flp pilus assembly protein TadB